MRKIFRYPGVGEWADGRSLAGGDRFVHPSSEKVKHYRSEFTRLLVSFIADFIKNMIV